MFGLGRESWNIVSGKGVSGNLEFGETGFARVEDSASQLSLKLAMGY
jgi:hypothetical protein